MTLSGTENLPVENAIGSYRGFYADRLRRTLADKSATKLNLLKAVHDYLREREQRIGVGLSVESELFEDMPEPFRGLLNYNKFKRQLTLNHSVVDADIWKIPNDNFQTQSAVESGGPIDEMIARKLKNSNFSHYRSPGQRVACQSALLMTEGEGLIINLPTGAGKTLVLHVLAKFNEAKGTALCVMPTNALKFEQAQRYYSDFCGSDSAYDSRYLAWPPTSDDDRSEILSQLESGRLPILFCAPEALQGGLLESLKVAARSGYLHSIVIDEAHLIEQWGRDFRPHYQFLPIVIDALVTLANHRLKVVLMSATWSSKVLDGVKRLFLNLSSIGFVCSGFLRAEPRYEIKRVDGSKFDQLHEELVKRPGPAIVYCIEKSGANGSREVFNLLKEQGWKRIGCFDGDVDPEQREELQRQWNANELDVMIATSAFGVGMDKSDIRTILHYGVPETVDRYYQDCGRAGRDGNPSSCLMLYTEADVQTAKRMSKVTYMLDDKSRNRFRVLIRGAIRNDGDRYVIATDILPSYLIHRGESNEGWNLKLLLFLVRLQVVKLDLLDRDEYQSIRNDDDSVYPGFKYLALTVLDYDVYSDEFWSSDYLEERSRQMALDVNEQKSLDTLLTPGTNLCDLFADYFDFEGRSPEKTCRGCPGHQELRTLPVGRLPFSSIFDAEPLTILASEPVGFQLDQDALQTDFAPCVRLIKRLWRSGKVKFIRCSREVKSRLLNEFSEGRWEGYVVFRDFLSDEISEKELTIVFQSDVDASGADVDRLVECSEIVVTDFGLQHTNTSSSVLDRLRTVYQVSTFEESELGIL